MSKDKVKGHRQVAEITTTCADKRCPRFTRHGVWRISVKGKAARHVLTCLTCGRERPLEDPAYTGQPGAVARA